MERIFSNFSNAINAIGSGINCCSVPLFPDTKRFVFTKPLPLAHRFKKRSNFSFGTGSLRIISTNA
jgi:hypothetical protein